MTKNLFFSCLLIGLSFLYLAERSEAQQRLRQNPVNRRPAPTTKTTNSTQRMVPTRMETNIMNNEAVELKLILNRYQKEAMQLFKRSCAAEWEAMTTGKEDAFKKSSKAKLRYAKYHSDPELYANIKRLRAAAKGLTPVDARSAEIMEMAFQENQLPPELMQKIFDMSAEIEKTFQTFQYQLDGKSYTTNELLELLEKENDSQRRQQIWDCLKGVGSAVDRQVVELAKVRNEAARQLGYANFWEMQIYFQDYKPAELLAIFDELEKLTTPLFVSMKKELDAELADRFGISPSELMPWHYDNPFFQQAPPSKKVDLNEFYKTKTKEEIIQICTNYFEHLRLPYKEVLKRSDMFEREGKNQHAFSIDMDTLGDVRNLCNVKPTVDWMDTVLHEGGHGVYSLGCDTSLPFCLRREAHIFTTEAVAMMFGAKARSTGWMIRFAGADPEKWNAMNNALQEQRRREQLIFCRWTLVMLHFEKALYQRAEEEGIETALRTLWWDMVKKYQLLTPPSGRVQGDWASKPHFVIAPVYYHNYMLGELFAAQLRDMLGPSFEQDDPSISAQLTAKVFSPGAYYRWPEFVRRATGAPLSAKAFSKELTGSSR